MSQFITILIVLYLNVMLLPVTDALSLRLSVEKRSVADTPVINTNLPWMIVAAIAGIICLVASVCVALRCNQPLRGNKVGDTNHARCYCVEGLAHVQLLMVHFESISNQIESLEQKLEENASYFDLEPKDILSTCYIKADKSNFSLETATSYQPLTTTSLPPSVSSSGLSQASLTSTEPMPPKVVRKRELFF